MAKVRCVRLGCEKRISRYSFGKDSTADARARRSNVDNNTRGEQTFGLHASEFGWSLPQGDSRHLFRFPTEIFIKILTFILVTPDGIAPFTMFKEQKKQSGHCRKPHYRVEDWTHKELPYCLERHSDGNYIAFFRAPVDATVLRVNKFLRQIGLPLFYGQNTFEFDLESRQYPRKVPLWMTPYRIPYKLPHYKVIQEQSQQNEIRDIFKRSQDEVQGSSCNLCGDAFLQFIHSIGQENASHIRSVRFIGALGPPIKGGYAFYDGQKYCSNLNYYTKIYGMLLKYHCKDLQILEICITKIAISYKRKKRIYRNYIGVFDINYTDNDTTIDDTMFDEDPNGDDSLETLKGVFRQISAYPEEMHLIRQANALFLRQNIIIRRLRQHLEEIISQMPNLCALKLMRPPPLTWVNHLDKQNKAANYNFNSNNMGHCSQSLVMHCGENGKPVFPVQLKFMKDLGHSIHIAALKRSQKRAEEENIHEEETVKEKTDKSITQLVQKDWKLTDEVGKRLAAGKEETYGGWGWSEMSKGEHPYNGTSELSKT